MKKFNIEEAKAGRPVMLSDRSPARIICYDRKDNHDYPIVLLVQDTNGNEEIEYSNSKGDIYGQDKIKLVMTNIKKIGWTNIYSTEDGYYTGIFYSNRAAALKNISENSDRYVSTVKIEFDD